MPDKSIADRLLIKPGYEVLVINAPQDYSTLLGPLPPDVKISKQPSAPADLIQIFLTSKKELEEDLVRLKAVLKPKGLLWITYPKGGSKTKTDLNRDIIRVYAQTLGLQAVAMIAIDDTWSALRLKKV